MSSQAERVKVIQMEAEGLKQYLAALPEDAWTKPSACADWEVRDVVTHLTGVMNNYRNHITRGLRGDTSTPEGSSEQYTFTLTLPEERQKMAMGRAQRIIDRREQLGTGLPFMFSQACDPFTQLVSNLNPHEWNKLCYHPWGLLNVRALVNAGVFELAIHGRDIRSALKPPPPLSHEALAVMLDHIIDSLHWFFPPSRGQSAPLCYRFELTGAVSNKYDIVIEADRTRMRAADDPPANVIFRCDTETFVLLMCGRIPFDAAVANGQLLVEGDSRLATELQRLSCS